MKFIPPIFLQFNRNNDNFSVFLSTNQDPITRWNDWNTKEQLVGFVSRITFIPLEQMEEMINEMYPYDTYGVEMLFLTQEIRDRWIKQMDL
jgi:hypothetical protein